MDSGAGLDSIKIQGLVIPQLPATVDQVWGEKHLQINSCGPLRTGWGSLGVTQSPGGYSAAVAAPAGQGTTQGSCGAEDQEGNHGADLEEEAESPCA